MANHNYSAACVYLARFKYKLITIFLLFIALVNCSERVDYKKLFRNEVSAQLKANNSIKVNLSEYFDFKWEKVCFGSGPNLEVKFYVDDTLIMEIEYGRYFYLREDYVDKSPSNKCFGVMHNYLLLKRKYNNTERVLIETIKD